MHLDSKTTIEDILNYKKTDIQSYLKSKGKKISGTKLELARRAYETNKDDNVNIKSVINSEPNLVDEKIVSIDSLKTGWTSEIQLIPKISHNDVENYLLHSSHRTEDKEKRECYRQFIRGFNFFKEGYVLNFRRKQILLYPFEMQPIYERGNVQPMDISVTRFIMHYNKGILLVSCRV